MLGAQWVLLTCVFPVITSSIVSLLTSDTQSTGCPSGFRSLGDAPPQGQREPGPPRAQLSFLFIGSEVDAVGGVRKCPHSLEACRALCAITRHAS